MPFARSLGLFCPDPDPLSGPGMVLRLRTAERLFVRFDRVFAREFGGNSNCFAAALVL